MLNTVRSNPNSDKSTRKPVKKALKIPPYIEEIMKKFSLSFPQTGIVSIKCCRKGEWLQITITPNEGNIIKKKEKGHLNKAWVGQFQNGIYIE